MYGCAHRRGTIQKYNVYTYGEVILVSVLSLIRLTLILFIVPRILFISSIFNS